MPEKLKEIYEKVSDKLYFITKKFDGLNELIFEKTGMKVNTGIIVLSIIFILLIIFFVRIILGAVFGFLAAGDYSGN